MSYFNHETAIIDEGCQIGSGTKIWHFSHIMKNCIIGDNCNIGQNVVVSPEVVLGKNVVIFKKIGAKDSFCERGTPAFYCGNGGVPGGVVGMSRFVPWSVWRSHRRVPGF